MSVIKFYNIKKAVQRLVWRFGNGKFEPNQSDANALQFIIDWINKDKEELLEDHLLFAKCYVKLLTYETSFYKDVKTASININKYLMEYPTHHFYDEFTKTLNQIEYEKYMKNKGFLCKHPATLSEKEREIEKKIIEDNLQEYKSIVFEGKWTTDQVYKSLNNQITELLKKKINN